MTPPLARLRAVARRSFAPLATALERLPRLGGAIGRGELWVRREDCTGLGPGCYKAPKLEFRLASSLEAERT